MTLQNHLSSKILGQISLMQSVVFKLPDNISMLKFVCQGFKDISGVQSVTYQLYKEGHPDSIGLIEHPSDCYHSSIIHRGYKYAALLFKLSDQTLFSPYIPFIENFCNMLGVIFDEQHQRKFNHTLMIDLENRVEERTRELKAEISEHEKTAESLMKSKERFREIVEGTDNLITRVDQQGNFIYVNHSALDVFGLSPEECTGLSAYSFVDPLDKERTKQWFEKCVRQKVLRSTFENRQISRSGEKKDMIWTASFKYGENGQIKYVNSIGQDISERRQLEIRLQQAQKMEAIGTLAGGIAHDFNNILFPVLGYTEMLQEDIPRDSPLQEYLSQVHKATLRASALVKQILTFSRQTEHINKPIKLQAILKEAIKLLSATIPSMIDIQSKIDLDCGMVIADSTQIHQIIMNLATNAYHSMQESGGKLKVVLRQIEIESDLMGLYALPPGQYALLKVIDTGTGIEKTILDRIFDPYFTTKEKNKGTGLGLSVVQGIVKACKGEIHVYSEPGQGTEVHIYFPIAEKVEDIYRIEALSPIVGGCESILLVDDEKAIISMEHQVLERLGYKVTSTTKSLEAFELFKASPEQFDLIVSDMNMPDMTGIQLTAKIKTIRKNIPVIICTGFSDQIFGDTREKYGIFRFIMKPVVRAELAKAIREALDQSLN